jgi:putative ABC transport system substrate-binding protein
MLKAAKAIGQEVEIFVANNEREIDDAFSAIAERKVHALLIGAGALFNGMPVKMAALAEHHSIPAMHSRREAVTAGGLVSYDASNSDIYRQAGVYAARILKGEHPADLPVLQPTKFELVLNLRTAKKLGLDLSPKLLALADEVIE